MNRFRITAMIPTEMYIDADDIVQAKSSVDWLFDQYPDVKYPGSIDEDGSVTMSAIPKVIAVEEITKEHSVING